MIWVKLPEVPGGGNPVTKRDIKVTLKPSEITVKFAQETEARVSGKLWNVLDSDSMTWTIQKDRLEITACKANVGLIWQRFLAAGVDNPSEDGEEVMDAAAVDKIHEQLAHLTTDNPMPDPGTQNLFFMLIL